MSNHYNSFKKPKIFIIWAFYFLIKIYLLIFIHKLSKILNNYFVVVKKKNYSKEVFKTQPILVTQAIEIMYSVKWGTISL
ncbi:MAG: hypothetical protein DRJ01_07130 [Bacteroidetes bacterium]|nr:MAG: hypothetical protein DRJ01_07130 [Bacteroidota bacterium]